MAPPRRKSQRTAGRPMAQSHYATPPVCTPCYVRLERCPDTHATGRYFVPRDNSSGPLPITWRIPHRKDPVIIDVWSLHPNASWRRKTAKTYERYHNQSDNERSNGAFDGNQGCQSNHPERVKRTDVRVGRNHTELLQEGILMRGEIEKKNVAKRATKVAELKPNITGPPSQSTNYIAIKTESDVRQLVPEEHHLSQKCVGDQPTRTVSLGLASRPASEVQIKSEPTNEQLSTVDQQMTFETSQVYTELKQLKREEGRVEEDSKRFHTYTNSVEGDPVQKAVDNKGDTLLLSHIQGGKALVHVQKAVKRHRARNKHSRKRKADGDEANFCRFCSKSFSGKHYLRKHQEKMVCFTALSCKTCGKKFANKMGMFQHSKTHTQVKPYSCGHCNRRFRWVSQLKVHLIAHIKDNSLIKDVCCSSCEWVTLPGALAIMELRRKTMHICKTCGKGFQLRMDGEPFQCQECNCAFTSMASLAGHRRSHKKKVFECSDCGEHFKSVYLLQKHREKDHPSERPYACKQCGERFPRKSGLETHQLAHEDQWSIPPPSPNRMKDVEEEDEIDSRSNDNELLAPVTDGGLLEPVILKPVKEEPCTFSILEPYQIKTESEDMPCYPFNSIKVERDDAFW